MKTILTTLTCSALLAGAVPRAAKAQVNPDPVAPSFTIRNAFSVVEGDGFRDGLDFSQIRTFEFVMELSKPSAVAISGTYSVFPGGNDPLARSGTYNTPGADFAGVTGAPFNIPVGSTSFTARVDVFPDYLDEFNENLQLRIQTINASALSSVQLDAFGRITDNDEPPPATLPTLTIRNAAVLEGTPTGVFTSITKNFAFEVKLSAPSPAAITGFYSAVTAPARPNPAQPEDDFFPKTNVFFGIPPNTPSATLNVLISSDNRIEPDEEFEVTLANVIGAQVPDRRAIVKIRNDDGPPAILVLDASATEPSGGPAFYRVMNFLVLLSHPNYTADTQVQFATRNDSALAGSGGISRDYDAAQGTLTIPANLEAGWVSVRVRGDLVQESTERFFLDLSNPVNATIADGQAIGTILQSTQATGDFALSLPGEPVAVDEVQPFTVIWTVPEGKVWRDLQSIDFRLRDRQGPAFWVRWDEAGNTFTLVEKGGHPHKKHGKGRKSDDGPSSGEPVGDPATPDSGVVLETRQARLDLDETIVQGSGPTGQSVTLILGVSFPKNSTGHAYAIELAATGDTGDEDAFVSAGAVFIEPRRGR